jgi:hypothetical protein
MEMGRGLERAAEEGRRGALATPGWDIAPRRVRNSVAARETVAYLLNRANATSGGREVRGMAARMGPRH